MKKLLIVDDDAILASSLQRALQRLNYSAESKGDGASALERIQEGNVDLILLDNKLPDMSGLDILQTLKRCNIKLPVILMTAFGTEETVIESMKSGAFDYITKPFDLNELQDIIRKGLTAYRFMSGNPEPLPCAISSADQLHRLVGHSKKMQEIYKLIGQIASTDLTVLIRGESGTGKELVAQSLFQHSHRSNNYFLAVNCAAIPETLLESELMGYEKGAFTGAYQRKIGKFEQCDQGTIFLDEVGDMPLATQTKILRVLQHKEFERIGGHETVKVDVRVITATNKPLEELIQKGLFREDLYYRLEAVTIHVPPLRERKEDIKDIAEYLFACCVKEFKSQVRMLDQSVFSKLESHDWPGNIRELSNTIRRAIALAKGETLTAEHIIFGGKQSGKEASLNTERWMESMEAKITPLIRDAIQSSNEGIYNSFMNPIEKILIKNVLIQADWNQVLAASMLGLSRTTLREKIKKYEIVGR